jgi:hypothetical protein
MSRIGSKSAFCIFVIMTAGFFACADNSKDAPKNRPKAAIGKESSPKTTVSTSIETVPARDASTGTTIAAKTRAIELPNDTLSLRALLPSRIAVEGLDEKALSTLQDDNLLTHVACPVSEGSPCIITIQFDEKVSISAIRLFPGSFESKQAFVALSKPKHVRIVGDAADAEAACAEAALENRFDYQTVSLASPMETQSLRIEVLDVFGRNRKASAMLSELDVLGGRGPSRPGLRVDFENLFVTADGAFRRKDKFNDTWIEQIDIHGQRQRMFKGGKIHGSKGRRFLLVEHLNDSHSKSDSTQTSRFELIDTKYRGFYSLPSPGLKSASVTPRQRREGFFFIGDNDGKPVAYSVTIDDEFALFLPFLQTNPKLKAKEITDLGFPKSALSSAAESGHVSQVSKLCKPMRKKDAGLIDALKQLHINQRWFHLKNVAKCQLPDGRSLYLLNDPVSDQVPSAVAVKQPDGKIIARSFCIQCMAELRVFTDGSVRIAAERDKGKGGDIFDLKDDGTLNLLIKDALFHLNTGLAFQGT